MTPCPHAALAGLILSVSLLPDAAHGAEPVLRLVTDVPLPGAAVRFDYQSIDTTSNRLYISHMNAGELLVLDLGGRRVERVIRDLPKVTGVCAVPALAKVYASVAGDHEVAVIDAATLRVEARVRHVGFPDGIAYAPDAKKVYVSDESGEVEVVIDGASNRVVRRIPLGGEAGNTIFDQTSRHILVAVQTRNEVVEIDPRTDRLVARRELPGAAHPHGLALDSVHRLLFVANQGNAMLLTVDLKTMHVVDKHRVGEDPDVLAFDPGPGRLFVSSESGHVSVFSVRGSGLIRDGDISIPHAHTVSVDPRTHLVYFPLQNINGHPVLRIMAAR